jgi:hypothetical protein
MNNNYNELEDQIGMLGAEEELSAANPKKLKHKTVYGQKEELSQSEEDSLNAFLSKDKARKTQVEESTVASGWIPINREDMGIRSMFYPESWEFFVKPATVQAIKNWTSIDEERIDQVNRVFNEVVKMCVKIDTHSKDGAGWAQINSWDRFWFILKVREYTFSTGEAKIEFTDACSECGDDVNYTLHTDNLFYEFPDDDLIEKYWGDGVWTIDPREYDVDHDPIVLYTPKLGKDEAIIDWATNKGRNGQKIDENFIEMLVWMLNKPSKDAQMFDRQVQKLQAEYRSWDVDMYTFMKDVIKNITVNPSEKLRVTCPHCSMEATSNVQFPNGIKALFNIGSKVKKFGSR